MDEKSFVSNLQGTYPTAKITTIDTILSICLLVDARSIPVFSIWYCRIQILVIAKNDSNFVEIGNPCSPPVGFLFAKSK